MDAKNVIDPRVAKIKELRAMAGRAFLDGPKRYKVEELEGPLLDLAVANAEGIKATIYLVPNAISPFYECAVLDEAGRLHYQFLPSRSWTQGGPIIDREKISLLRDEFAAHWDAQYIIETGEHWQWRHQAFGVSPLVAAMRCYVRSKFGEEVEL